ncbi:MAG: class I SAM-dependent methyltransferase [Eubacteriales bacterium]|nr:class I SAM-dependent methyltransferase [Eubacteriales bacterium]
MKLDERLSVIAGEVLEGLPLADIGTDHGYLGIELCKECKCPHVIMTDVSHDSLEKAKRNAAFLVPDLLKECRFEFREGDGLSVLKAGEAGTVTIAGMGGIMMADIIGADTDVSASVRRFVLQPRNNAGRLRLYLQAAGIGMVRERFAREKERICEIFVCQPGASVRAVSREELSAMDERYKSDPAFAAEADFPAYLAESSDPLVDAYLELNLNKQRRILEQIYSKSDAKGGAGFAEARVRVLEEILECRKRNS